MRSAISASATGVEVDKAEAARLHWQAAERGHADAQRRLGWCYEHGQGVGQDVRAAMDQYILAAEGGCLAANANLGICFEKGRGVPRSDPAEAARLYTLAAADCASAEQVFEYAMGVLPEESVPADVSAAAAQARNQSAVSSLNRAARRGHAGAAKQLEVLAGRRDVVSACCVGCGAVRKLKTCSKCRTARFCDAECTARMWPAHRASCRAWRVAELIGRNIRSAACYGVRHGAPGLPGVRGRSVRYFKCKFKSGTIESVSVHGGLAPGL
jgi:TPR repeat protein